uniref:Uncharacterized protein n=1 Tax=Candidatus Kentrum sp. DK TaxID=2126562 RepID=A0A450TAV0_9GAMM|nr:MAG: hypothetical protein BECKDK2373C_GA0170839_111118 [Candidatus Kentron sp. DK]
MARKWVIRSIFNLFIAVIVGIFLPSIINFGLAVLDPSSPKIAADGLTSLHVALVVFLSVSLIGLAFDIQTTLSRIHTEADQSIEKFIKQYINTEIDRSILRIFSVGVANDSSTTTTFIEFLQGIIRDLESLPEPIRFPILFLATRTRQIITHTKQKASDFELQVPIQIQVELSSALAKKSARYFVCDKNIVPPGEWTDGYLKFLEDLKGIPSIERRYIIFANEQKINEHSKNFSEMVRAVQFSNTPLYFMTLSRHSALS